MEARAELEQRGDAAAGLAGRWSADDPGDEMEERGLAGAVPADQADRLAGRDPNEMSRSAQTSVALGAVPGERSASFSVRTGWGRD